MRRMVSDTRSTLRARNGADEKNSKKKVNNGKDTGTGTSVKANVVSLARSGRDAPVSAQSAPQGIRKSKRLENEAAPSTSSPMRKSERLEKHKTPSPSPLSKSDRLARALSSGSSGQKQPAKELSFSEEKMNKEQKRKNVIEASMESEKAEIQEEVGKKRKKITGAAYKAMYSYNKAPQRIRLPDKAVDGLPGKDGLPDSQTVPSSREILCDHRRQAANSAPNIDNADSPDSESSISLPRPRDGITHSESGEKCTDPKDISGVVDGCKRLSMEATDVDTIIHKSPDVDGIKDPLTSPCVSMLRTNSSPIKNLDTLQKESSTCLEILQDISEIGEKPVRPEETTPFPRSESEDVNLSGNCLLCSKRKRANACSTENDICSCVGSPRENLGRYSSFKNGGDVESAENCNSGDRLKETRSYPLMEGQENVISNRSNSGEIPFLAANYSKQSIRDGGTSRFLEYWIPVQISFHQLEQYCDALLSNSIHLYSCEKRDTNGAFQETLQRVRKCCDHPYLLDLSFQSRLINVEKRQAPEVLDVAIRASGKLEVLDMMLTEIRSRGSQVLILLQLLPASGKNMSSNADLLDEFLNKRFGRDSYERIDALSFKKQAAVDRFNKKENGAFVLLLEKGACSSSIKRLSLDNIIIYGSDWNPSNDLKTLQKLSFDSKLAQVKVFRLYSSYTIEERVLILAKKNVEALPLQNKNRATVDNLLMWGASHLFSKLNDFHVEYSSSLNVSSQHSFLSEVMEEFRAIIGGSYDNVDRASIISRANKLDSGVYKTNVPLFGETKITMNDVEEPHLFWKNLLESKNPPSWKFLEEPSPRNRKRVQFLDASISEADINNGNVSNKRRKAGMENRDPAAVQVEPNGHLETQVAEAERACNLILNQTPSVSEGKDMGLADRTVSAVDHNSFHNSLLADLNKLCDVLQYSENATLRAIKLLEYFSQNFRLSSDSPAFMEAFQISLCWIAASDSRLKVDKELSLDMARNHLKYQCSEEEVYNVYSKMRSLKTTDLEGVVQPTVIGEKSDELVEVGGGGNEVDEGIVVTLQKKCLKRQKKLKRKQQKQIQEFHQIWDDKMQKLETDHQLQLAFARSMYGETRSRKERVQHLEDVYAKKLEEHNLLRDVELKELEAEHLAVMNAEKQKADFWLTRAKECSLESSIGNESPTPKKILVTSNSKNEVGVTEINRSSMDVVEQPSQPKHSCDIGEPAFMGPPASEDQSAGLAEESPADVPEASTAKTDPKENGLQNKIETLAVENLAAEQQNREELFGQKEPSSHLEVPDLEHTKSVTAVQANSGLQEDEPEKGKLHEDEAEEGEILEKKSSIMEKYEDEPEDGKIHEGEPEEGEILENESPALDNQTTVEVRNSISVAIVAPVEKLDGNVRALENQDTSKTQVGMLEPVDSPTNAVTSKPVDSLKERVPPAVENECTLNDAISDVVDTVDSLQPIMEQAHTDALTVQTEVTCPFEVPISEAAATAIPLQLSIDIPVIMNSEQMDRASPSCNQLEADQRINSSQTAEVAETDLLLRGSSSQTEDNLAMRTSIHGRNIELPTSEHNMAISHSVISAPEYSSEAVLRNGINAGQYSRTGYPVNPTTPQVHLWNNPIRNEVERLNKEKQNLEQNHLDTAARLKCDCEREIEEITNQIKHKYAMRLQESEAEFKQKRIGIEKNLEQSCMNLKLADSFSEKCLDRPPGNSGHQQGNTYSGVQMQQMQRLPISPRVPASSSSFPSPSSHAMANPVQPSSGHLNNANPVQPFPSHLNASHIQQRPIMPRIPLSHPIRPSPSSSHTVMVPPVQGVQRTMTQSRPPVINSITPHNPHFAGEIRCQAPHLQSSRSAHGPTAPASTPPSISQYQSILLPSKLSALQLSQNGPGHQPQGGLQVQPNLSPNASASALMHHHRLRPASLPETSPSPSLPSMDPSQLGALGNVQSNRVSPNVAEDLVCLSDDD